MEDLGHRASFDLDFHTRNALEDTRRILAEIEAALPGRFELLQPPADLGSGFSGLLALDDGERVPVQVLSKTSQTKTSWTPGVSQAWRA